MSSLIEYDANLPLEADNSANEGATEAPQTNLMALAWQARWLMLLTVLLGIGGAWLLLQRVEPRFTSMSRIYIERNLPRILTNDIQAGNSSSFLYAQAELLLSTPVLVKAVEAPGIAQLESFRIADNPIGLLRRKLDVQVGQNDDIINVAIELPKAEDAAQIVNSVVDAYISTYADKRQTDTVEILQILRTQKGNRDSDLARCLSALETFRSQNAALAVQVGQENVITMRFARTAEKLDGIRLRLLDAKARHHRTQKMFESPSQRPFLLELARGQQSVAQDIRVDNQLQIGLEKQIRDVELQLNTLRAVWGDGHTKVRLSLQTKKDLEERLAKQLAAVEERKETIVKAYVETIGQEYQLLEQQRAELQREYDTQEKLAVQVNTQSAKLLTLEDALKRAERNVDILDEQISKVNLTENVGSMDVNIMEVAMPSPVPSYPIRTRFLALGALLGGLTGFGLAWLRDLMDHRLKSIDEITATMQLPVLGALPLTAGREERNLIGRVVLEKPRSMAAEAFRTLRTAIHFGLTRDEARIISVTSPSPGDGKSTVASNLAITMAQADQRILMIDADMRKPKQHTIFGVDSTRGLSAALSERVPAAELIQKTELESLDLLPCGSCPTNPVELLNNGYFSEFLTELLKTYDKILIDSPPVMPVADARVISAQTDATILVLRAERSTRRLSLAARDELWRVRAQRIGIVVNAVPDRKQSSYYSGYGYGYGYGTYGYRSGSYGDVAYGHAEAPLENGKRKKSRALTSQTSSSAASAEAGAEEFESVDS